MNDIEEFDLVRVAELIPGDSFRWAGAWHDATRLRPTTLQGEQRFAIDTSDGRTFLGHPGWMLNAIAVPRPDEWEDDHPEAIDA